MYVDLWWQGIGRVALQYIYSHTLITGVCVCDQSHVQVLYTAVVLTVVHAA